MKPQIIKDTAEYNYKLGYEKALKDVEKMIDKMSKKVYYKYDIIEHFVVSIKKQLKELGDKQW